MSSIPMRISERCTRIGPSDHVACDRQRCGCRRELSHPAINAWARGSGATRGREPRPTSQPLTYLGRRVSRGAITPTRAAFARMRVRVGAALRDPDPRRIERTLASYRGVLGLGDTFVDADDNG